MLNVLADGPRLALTREPGELLGGAPFSIRINAIGW